MNDCPSIRSVETFIISISRERPYLGPRGPGERSPEALDAAMAAQLRRWWEFARSTSISEQ